MVGYDQYSAHYCIVVSERGGRGGRGVGGGRVGRKGFETGNCISRRWGHGAGQYVAVCFGSRPLNSTWRHGNFLNSTCDIGP